MTDAKHGVKMGISSKRCDDGKRHTEKDWNGSPTAYTCYSPKKPLAVKTIDSIRECQVLKADYMPKHFCMNKTLHYNTTIPTYGDHRPLWAVYGEYLYLPPQRWLHNVEHGAIVVLYDPCAHPAMVNRLRGLVMSCLRKYIKTPYNKLPKDRPLALVAWGCKLQMNYVDPGEVVQFIKENALKGPEGAYSKQGQFSRHLLSKSVPVSGSNYEDEKLCPLFP
jgi:hypothetical protein